MNCPEGEHSAPLWIPQFDPSNLRSHSFWLSVVHVFIRGGLMCEPLRALRLVVIFAILSNFVIIFALEGHAEIYVTVDVTRLNCCKE